jgi:outer membrane receptor protein involved in Fe transport
MGAMSAAVAQGADAELEEITVTGSRIAKQDYSSASPISTVEAELFKDTGAPTIETVLNGLPQFVPALTSTSNNPSNGGQANVSLRGLGTTRTLVLLDGRRIVPSNPTGVVDLNLIPASIIQNVEIITGGASAVYGSDAVAGVVNIKTRNFTGVELTGGYGETSEGDGGRTSFGLTAGMESDDGRGYAFGTVNWAERDGIFAGDRDFSSVGLDWDDDAQQFEPVGSATIRQGRWDALSSNLPTQAGIDAYFAGVPGYMPGDAAPGHNYAFNPDGSIFDVSPVINFTGDMNEPLQPVNPSSYTYNFSPVNYLELPLERKSFFGKAGFELNDTTEIFVQALWADYNVDTILAPTPASSLYVRPDNPNLDPAVAALLATRPTPDEPFRMRKRMIESGGRVSANDYNVLQLTAGMNGTLGFAPSWDWDVYASWGNVDHIENQLGNVSRSAWHELALADDHGASLCGAAINPFGINSISPECAAYVTKSATNNETVKQTVVEGYVTGPVFDMPAGSVDAAVGVMYKSDDYAFLPDASLSATTLDPVTGAEVVDINGFNAQDTVRGSTDSKELYFEVAVPLLADLPAINRLDVTAGYRFADHSVAEDMNSYKLEGTWDVTDSFGFRGGYQRAVRAPNISELFRPNTINFPAVGLGDPCSNDFTDPDGFVEGAQDSQRARDLCIAQGIAPANVDGFLFANGQFQGLSGGNPNLQEETADTVTFGAVFRGHGDGFLSGFQASLDWYQIEIEDTISAIDADVLVERCFDERFNPNFSNSNQFCQLFRRDVGTGEIIDALEADTNIAQNKVTGIDFQVDYVTDLGPGVLDLHWVSTNLMEWDEAITSADPFDEFAGTASSSFNALPEWKWSASAGYEIGGFDGEIRWRYVGEMTDRAFPNFKLDSVDYLDLSAGYTFGGVMDGLRARIGVTNLTDEMPIIYPSSQQANTDPATYDVLGRRYFANLTYTFE